MTEYDGYVCNRVADHPTPHVASAIGLCNRCQAEVWISQRAIDAGVLTPDIEVICVPCILAAEPEPEIRVHPVIAAEVLEYLDKET